jgi:hypothetical protein
MYSPCVQIGASIMTWPKPTLTLVFLCALVLASGPWGCAYAATQSPAPSATQVALETPEELQQLVAPIALYPEELVAEIGLTIDQTLTKANPHG